MSKLKETATSVAVHCGVPMVSTFMFSGAEFYCPKCGESQGMFNTDRIDITDELREQYDENEKKFRGIAGDCIPAGCRFDWCGICQGKKEAHRLHASQDDLKKSDAAYQKLYRGILS